MIGLVTWLFVLLVGGVQTAASQDQWSETGIASWYGPGFVGRPTASGEIYDPRLMTAAHKTLPLGTLVRVFNLDNGQRMIVRINDRGPFIDRRIIDLSGSAAEVLGFKESGLARVRIELLDRPSKAGGRSVSHKVQNAVNELLKLRDKPTPPSPVNTQTEGYVIQVGAFHNLEYADERADEMQALQLEAHTEFKNPFYRVFVGPFDTLADANVALRHLKSAGKEALLHTSRRSLATRN